ncbi:MAG TPA: hypothetical protein VM098_08575, partial [Phycisphaerae bacterium]|nr:hypothetical protein [Phycisphaerae bacterium]
MRDHAGGSAIRSALAWAVALAAVSPSAAAAEPQYILEDLRVSGKQIHAFADADEQVTVVLGDFQLALDQRRLSGRDAVLWIRQQKFGKAERHDITVYVEGDARLVEPDGTTTVQATMLVTLHQQGRISAGQVMAGRPLTELPLYRSALQARERAKTQPAPQERQTKPSDRLGPLVIETPPPAGDEAPSGMPPGPQGESPRMEPVPDLAQPVTFHAENVTSQVRGNERILIARGDVYLSEGDPDSALFLELRAQAAVVFTEKRMPGEKDSRSPLAPGLGGVETP